MILSLVIAFYLGSIIVNDYVPTISSTTDLSINYKIISASIYSYTGKPSNLYLELLLILNHDVGLNNTKVIIGDHEFHCMVNNTERYTCYVDTVLNNIHGSSRLIFEGIRNGLIIFNVKKAFTTLDKIYEKVTPSVNNMYCISTNNKTSYFIIELASNYYYTGNLMVKFVFNDSTSFIREFNVTIKPDTTTILKVKSICSGDLKEIVLIFPFNYTKTYAVVKK